MNKPLAIPNVNRIFPIQLFTPPGQKVLIKLTYKFFGVYLIFGPLMGVGDKGSVRLSIKIFNSLSEWYVQCYCLLTYSCMVFTALTHRPAALWQEQGRGSLLPVILWYHPQTSGILCSGRYAPRVARSSFIWLISCT